MFPQSPASLSSFRSSLSLRSVTFPLDIVMLLEYFFLRSLHITFAMSLLIFLLQAPAFRYFPKAHPFQLCVAFAPLLLKQESSTLLIPALTSLHPSAYFSEG